MLHRLFDVINLLDRSLHGKLLKVGLLFRRSRVQISKEACMNPACSQPCSVPGRGDLPCGINMTGDIF